MPRLTTSAYRPPTGLRNGHLQTIYPALLRKPPALVCQRQRIDTADGDFLDLDWLSLPQPQPQTQAQAFHGKGTGTPPTAHPATGAQPLAILTHGLEGSSRQTYMLGMAQTLLRRGWRVLAWNLRGCSGEDNRLPASYHSGATADLHTVIEHVNRGDCAPTSARVANTARVADANRAATTTATATAVTAANADAGDNESLNEGAGTQQANNPYGIALIGFSLGDNLTLKYLGEAPGRVPPNVRAAVAISVPCQLAESTKILERRRNRLYMERFLKTLRAKVRGKYSRFPEMLDIRGLDKIRTFAEFDNRYTAPLNGFASAEHYWQQCSCAKYLDAIRIPSLLLNAQDDPFLAPGCFPHKQASASEVLFLETPPHGGHVGFVSFNADGSYWSENRAADFLQTFA